MAKMLSLLVENMGFVRASINCPTILLYHVERALRTSDNGISPLLKGL
jgi:hypothetical protein